MARQLMLLRASTEESWLGAVAAALGLLDGPQCAVAAALGTIGPGPGLEVDTFGSAGMPSEPAAQAARQALATSLAGLKLAGVLNASTPFAILQPVLHDPGNPQEDFGPRSLDSIRAGSGLHGAVRVVSLFQDESGTRGLVVQLDGRLAAWKPWAGLAAALAESAAMLVEQYVYGFSGPRCYRSGLLRVLTPVQRELLPLLVAGHPERDIARLSRRSIHTVHEHTKSIYLAWDVRSRMELREKWLMLHRMPGYQPPVR